MASKEFNVSELRIVLLGNTGVGKSATGNAILGKDAFKETETRECETERGKVEERDVLLIDTPGINSTAFTTEQWRSEIEKCVFMSSLGPHVFLLVIRLGRFTEDQKNTVRWIWENFGEEALKFTMILFTEREQWSHRQCMSFLQGKDVLGLIGCCGGGYSVMNSKPEITTSQIRKLLMNINAMVKKNSLQHYHYETHHKVKGKIREKQRKEEEAQGQGNGTISDEENDKTQQVDRREESEIVKFQEKVSIEMEKQQKDLEHEENRRQRNASSTKEQWMTRDKTRHVLEETEDQRDGEEMVKEDGENKTMEEHVMRIETELRSKHSDNEENSTNQTNALVKLVESQKVTTEQTESTKAQKQEETGGNLTSIASEVRIVLLGKTGSGMSTTGNTILGREAFKEQFSFDSVTRMCEKHDSTVGGRRVVVVDTPGLLHSVMSNEEVERELKKSILLCLPGPHVFLLVMKPWMFTLKVDRSIQTFQNIFGKKALKFMILLFTNGDEKSKVDIKHCLCEYQIFENCSHGIYHIFNNKNKDSIQVTKLLEKIDDMMCRNGRQYYTAE